MIKIISISGLDGSGKSTQIELLKTYLEEKGGKVFYFHSVQFSIANKIMHSLKSPFIFFGLIKKRKDEKTKSVTSAKKWQIWLRKIVLGIDLKRFETLIKNLEKNGYSHIISDRYFYDNIINIEYLTAKLNPDFRDENLLGFDKKIIKPNISIYLQTDPKEIIQRANAPEQGIVYLELKKKLYDGKSDIIGWTIVNGNREPDVVRNEIKNVIEKKNV